MQISSPPGGATLPSTAMHEMGHSLGLSHSGALDTRQTQGGFSSGWWNLPTTGEAPVMNGCDAAGLPGPGPDDWSSLTNRVIGNGQISAEAGFESPTVTEQVWRGALTVETSSPKSGTRYISLGPDANVEQRTRVFGTTLQRFRLRSNYKSNGTGAANFKVFGKRLNYSSWPCGSVSFIDSDWVAIQSIGRSDPNGASTWEAHSPASSLFPGASWTNFEVRMQIYNATGDRLYIDNAKLELT